MEPGETCWQHPNQQKQSSSCGIEVRSNGSPHLRNRTSIQSSRTRDHTTGGAACPNPTSPLIYQHQPKQHALPISKFAPRRKKQLKARILRRIRCRRGHIVNFVWGGCAICVGTSLVLLCGLIFFVPWTRDPYDAKHHRKAKSTMFNRLQSPLLLKRKTQTTGDSLAEYHWSRPHARNVSHHERNAVPDDWKRGPWAIFYNIYIPNSDVAREVDDALQIVDEQLAQIAASPACSRQPLTLFYNIIGNIPALTEATMKQLCHSHSLNLECQLLGEYEAGVSESVTLRQLHGFCHHHTDFRVTYLHTKGSFHASSKNTHWRRLLTAAAVAPECVQPPNATCNLCGLQFFTAFTFFIPGNMFTAHCSYIQKLLPFENDTYSEAREAAVTEVLLLKLRNQLRGSLLWDQRDFLGLDRYQDEHWVGSHPDIVPCDMDPVGDLLDVFDGILQEHELEWGMGPRNTGICGGINDNLQADVRNNLHLRRRELLFLPGLLTKWYTMYGQAPQEDSWVWDFFPEGRDVWLPAVRRHKSDAVRALTDIYRFSADGVRLNTAFADDNVNHNATTMYSNAVDTAVLQHDLGRYSNFNTNLTIDTEASPTFALFYHIGLPNAHDGSINDRGDVDDSLTMVQEQLNLVKQSVAMTRQKYPVPLFYSVAGVDDAETAQKVHKLVSSVCDKSSSDNDRSVPMNHLHCRPLIDFDVNYEGETLRQMYRFCQRYPTFRVSYFHNQAPMQLRNEGENGNLIRHLTHAVTSQLCLEPEKESCNVCGLLFYTLWAFFFPGNFFVASCKYVRKLLPPAEFEDRMRDVVRQFLLQRLRNQVTTGLFPDRMDYYGLDRYALDYWIGSHPSLEPCDLSEKGLGMTYWRQANTTSVDDPPPFHWALAPRQLEAPYDMNWMMKENVFQNDSHRLREYFFLAGLLSRMYSLYQQYPKPFSWVWLMMPDGLKWLRAQNEFGARVVEKLTAEYSADNF